MNYEKKYEEALERAKAGKPIDEVFPELKESEDEKIRKYIRHELACLRASEGNGSDRYYALSSAIAYLEKQKEQKWSPSEGEMRVLYKLCYLSNQITDDDDTELTRLYQDLKREYFDGHSFENMFLNEKQKPSTPKFKVGDVMRTKQEAAEGITDGLPVIVSVDDNYYYCTNERISISEQEEYEFPSMNTRQKPVELEEEGKKTRRGTRYLWPR